MAKTSSLMQRLLSVVRRKRATDDGARGQWRVMHVGRSLAFGQVTEDKALSLPAYYACIRNIAEDVAKLPLIVYERQQPRGKNRKPDHPVYTLLHDQPNPEMTAQSFRETLTHWAVGWGSGFAEIERDVRGRPLALWPIHPARVEAKRDEDGRLVFKVRQQTGAATVIDDDDMLHVHGLGGGIIGYSVLQYAAESLGLSLSAQEFGSSFYGNGSTPGGVLEFDGEVDDETLENLRASWESMHRGSDNAGRIAILEQGLKYKAISIPPEQAQMLETRQFQIAEVCRWFRMPLHKVQHLEGSNYNTVEAENISYVVDALQPWLTRWEQEIRRKLFLPGERLFAEHLVAGLLRGDTSARSAFYKNLFDMGSLSPNDIRELENMNPITGGDQYFIPVNNLAPLEQAGQIAAHNQTQGQPPKNIDRDAVVRSAVPLFEDAASRVASVEAKFLRRTLRKDASNIQQHARGFYEMLDGDVRYAFEPCVRAIAQTVAGQMKSEQDVDAWSASFTDELAGRWVESSVTGFGQDVTAHLANLDGARVQDVVQTETGLLVDAAVEYFGEG